MKYFTTICLCIAFSLSVHAQTNFRRAYVSIGKSNTSLKQSFSGIPSIDLNSDFGAFLNFGKTYFVLKNPLAGMVNIGIDVTFLDINYNQFKQIGEITDEYYDYVYNDATGEYIEHITTDTYQEEFTTRQAEVGMQFGPSVHIQPVPLLNIAPYLRYAPSYAMTLSDMEDSEFQGGFGSFFVTGLSVNYTFIGLGIEKRWGRTKGKSFIEDIGDFYSSEFADNKVNLNGSRVYLSFRF